MWNQELYVTLVWDNDQAIVVQCILKQSRQTWCMATVYASNFERKRRKLWMDLPDCIDKNQGTWHIGGDFNYVRFQHEKMGGNLVLASKLIPFNKIIETAGLSHPKIIGANWTWTNRQMSSLITCKVDRILVNDERYGLFTNVSALAERLILSDHSPIVVIVGEEVTHRHNL